MTDGTHSFAAPWRARARVVEAMALIASAGVLQKAIPIRRWSKVIGEPAPVPSEWRTHEAIPARGADLDEDRVRRAIRRASDRLPWTPSCLAQAAAGQVMLRQRGKSGVVVIGLRATTADRPWDAHAWLLGRCGALSGAQAAEGFTPTAVFEVPGGLHARDVDLEVPTGRR